VLIRGADLLMRGELTRADIRVDGGRITEVTPAAAGGVTRPAPEPADRLIDADGLLALPGAVDPHVHFDDPGYTQREDFLHGSRAAAAAGITTVIDMPCTSVPPVTSLANLEEKLAAVRGRAVVDYGFHGGVSAASFSGDLDRTMGELAPWVLGFKTYFVSGMESFGRLDHHRFFRVLQRARELRVPVLLHAEDYEYVSGATEEARRAGSDPADYYRSRPEIAEVLAVGAAVRLALEARASLHVVHVGTAQAVRIAAEAAAAADPQAPITCETGPHYLAFDLEDFVRLGSALKTTPPVKSPGNREELWRELACGNIAFAASDHAPCPAEEKRTGSIWTDYAGIPGCCTLLPYLYSEGYAAGRLSLAELIRVTSEGAARRYGLSHRKGAIEAGRDADIVLIDRQGSWTVRGRDLASKGKITPFEGMTLQGRIVMTLRRGQVVYDAERGFPAEQGSGELLRPSR